MKSFLRTLFSPLLNIFENSSEEYSYKPLNRKILLVISFLFGCLASVVLYLIPENAELAYYLPVIIFGSISSVGFIVGFVGNDRAVSKIWGNRS